MFDERSLIQASLQRDCSVLLGQKNSTSFFAKTLNIVE